MRVKKDHNPQQDGNPLDNGIDQKPHDEQGPSDDTVYSGTALRYVQLTLYAAIAPYAECPVQTRQTMFHKHQHLYF